MSASTTHRGRRIGVHLLSLLAIAGFAVLGAGTASSDGDGSSSADPADEGPSPSARYELEGHFEEGEAYGDGPGGAQIAQELEPLLDPGMGDALALRVVPGPEHKTVVALLRLRDLRDFDDDEREAWLDSFGETIRDELSVTGEEANIVVGIRGNVFYGAVASLRPGAPDWRVDTGAAVNTDPIDIALNPEPAEPAAPAPAAQAPAAPAVPAAATGAVAPDDKAPTEG